MGEIRARIFSKFRDVFASFALSSDAKVVRAERLTYLSAQKILRLERSLDDVIREEIPGDVLEFGVALGGSSVLLAKIAIRDGRSFHGFDVLATIPPPRSIKDDQN
jgi:asparagine synthase (glutamine-hydrolysing)